MNLNCWRAQVFFLALEGVIWDGIPIKSVLGTGASQEPVRVVLGGAMFNGQPVYLNETHNLSASANVGLLVIEEFFDGATRPNN